MAVKKSVFAVSSLAIGLATVTLVPVGTTLVDFFLSGSQPNQSGTFTASCNCHDGYNTAVEPMFNWKGSIDRKSVV